MATYDWAELQKKIFATESGGDYNALFNYSNKPGKLFSDTSLTDMSVNDALAFSNPGGPYANYVKTQVGRVATPMGAYQIVGTTLRDAKKALGLTGEEKMTPKLQDRLGQWIAKTQGPGAWEGIKNLSSANTTPGGGLLTSNQGISPMIDPAKKPYMMGGDQTYSFNPQAAQQAQPQQGGLGGLLSTLKDKATAVDPRTGLTGFQQFASALDPLIMKQFRGGESIREAGAGRVAAGNKNRTVEMLKARGRKDLAEMVERGMISPTDAAGQLLAVPKEKGRTVDAAALRKMFPGAQIEDGLYNLKPNGTATKVGGGGVNVSVGGEGAEAFDKEFGKLDAQAIADVAAVGSSASRSLMQIDRLETLLGNVPTGMSANIKQLAGNFGIQTEGLGDIQAATAIINALVPAQRPQGSGPMSDADLDLFKESLPRIINSPGGNQMIIDTMRGLAQYDAMGSEIVQRLRAKEISKVDAFKLLNSRPDPFASFKASVGPAPADMSAEGARKLLEENQ